MAKLKENIEPLIETKEKLKTQEITFKINPIDKEKLELYHEKSIEEIIDELIQKDLIAIDVKEDNYDSLAKNLVGKVIQIKKPKSFGVIKLYNNQFKYLVRDYDKKNHDDIFKIISYEDRWLIVLHVNTKREN